MKSRLAAVYSGGARRRTDRAWPRIAVVGAGLAGLTTAYVLQQAGCPVTLYEASSRVGGRVQTDIGSLGHGMVSELGAEFIDSTHLDMLALATHFGLSLIDTHAPSEVTLSSAYFIGGRHYSEADVSREFALVAPRIAADAAGLSKRVDARQHSPHDAALDRTSIAEYLDKLGLRGWLRQLIDVAYLTEYGLQTDEQSSLNLLRLIGTGSEFAVFGDSDQRYKVLGGNERITQALARDLESSIALEHRLERLRRDARGVRLEFAAPGGAREVQADMVVLAMPFTLLRKVDLGESMPPAKLRAIQELGYGMNAKLLAGMHSRPWRAQGHDGDLYADLSFQTGWDGSRQRAGDAGAYTFYLGGNAGVAIGSGTPESHAGIFTGQLDAIFSGAKDQYNGNVLRAHWPSEPHALGSYTCYRPGQWTTLAGHEGRRVGPIHFAGEHCSPDFQGFMNGAAKSGRLVATGLLASL
jgi:monoamine oxidase